MKDYNGKEFTPTEMYKLINYLVVAGIPFEVQDCWDAPQVCYPSVDNRICDAVCHAFSYGHERGELEIMGLLTEEEERCDGVLGWLTAREVFNRIADDYFKVK